MPAIVFLFAGSTRVQLREDCPEMVMTLSEGIALNADDAKADQG